MRYETVGVVGAGVMGVGVAQTLAQTGHRVVLVDRTDDALARARTDLRDGLRSHRLRHGRDAEDSAAVRARITTTTDYDDLAEVDFVVENITEDWSLKEPVYRRLDAVTRPEVVLAANTSALSITLIASVTQRPDRVVGMHFMNPVPMKPVVETIRGHHTSARTLADAAEFLGEMGKESILVEDVPGFVTNRVLMLTINEAAFVVQDGVADAATVDRIFKTCFDHRMGPLETADLIGIDTILQSVEVLRDSFADDKYRPAPLLKKMVAAGLLGRKSGEGFHSYQ